jgi:hypothetical protein
MAPLFFVIGSRTLKKEKNEYTDGEVASTGSLFYVMTVGWFLPVKSFSFDIDNARSASIIVDKLCV